MDSKELLIKAANEYYNGRPNLMDDKSYDELKLSVEMTDPEFNLWSHIVIDEDDRASMPHPIPYTPQEFKTPFESIDEVLSEWSNFKNWIPTYKFDGTSVTAYYKNGKLYNILTRSDELVGKKKLDQLRNKVKQVVDPKVIKIDYECICSQEDFPDDTRSHSNGLINSCYKQDEVDKYITAIPFKVTCDEVTKIGYLDSFKLAGYTEEYLPVINKFPAFDVRYVEYLGKHYPIDGFVFYSNEDNLIPHKIFKHYGNQSVMTTVNSISWNKSDYLTYIPKIEFDPIVLDGRSVSRCASGGISNLRNLKCGVGASIEVILANSTIPQIISVKEESENYEFLKECPICHSPMEEVQNKLRCSNLRCPEVFNEIIYKFFENTLYPDLWLSLDEDEVRSVTDVDKLIEFLNKYNVKLKLRNVCNFSSSLLIERFNRAEDLYNIFNDNLDIIEKERKIDNIEYDIFTDNQFEIFERFIPIIDDIIDKVILI